MANQDQPRQHKGVSTGGRWVTAARDDDVDLDTDAVSGGSVSPVDVDITAEQSEQLAAEHIGTPSVLRHALYDQFGYRPISPEPAQDDAEFAHRFRDRVGQTPGWGEAEYQVMAAPWRRVVGPVHPDDPDGEEADSTAMGTRSNGTFDDLAVRYWPDADATPPF